MTTKLTETDKTLRKLEKLSGKPLTLGTTLWSIRTCDEMTQETFGKILGVSKNYISDIENSRRFISPATAAKFAEILGHSVPQFVRLCLQDQLDREGIPLTIYVEAA